MIAKVREVLTRLGCRLGIHHWHIDYTLPTVPVINSKRCQLPIAQRKLAMGNGYTWRCCLCDKLIIRHYDNPPKFVGTGAYQQLDHYAGLPEGPALG